MRTRNLEELDNTFPFLAKGVEINRCLVRVGKLRAHQSVFNSVNMCVVGKQTPTRSEVCLTTIKRDIIKMLNRRSGGSSQKSTMEQCGVNR
jgi:hypothetical protein